MDLCAPAIGDDLKSERERLGLSIADVAKHTRIKATYLSAIEALRLYPNLCPISGARR